MKDPKLIQKHTGQSVAVDTLSLAWSTYSVHAEKWKNQTKKKENNINKTNPKQAQAQGKEGTTKIPIDSREAQE